MVEIYVCRITDTEASDNSLSMTGLKKVIGIVYCTTKIVLADYLTNHCRGCYYLCLEISLWDRKTSVHCTRYMPPGRSMLESLSVEAKIRKIFTWNHCQW